jgi:hypothetical protein
VRYHITLTRIAFSTAKHSKCQKNLEKLESMLIAVGMKNDPDTGQILKKLSIELASDLAIPLLGVYPQRTEVVTQNRYLISMFTEA